MPQPKPHPHTSSCFTRLPFRQRCFYLAFAPNGMSPTASAFVQSPLRTARAGPHTIMLHVSHRLKISAASFLLMPGSPARRATTGKIDNPLFSPCNLRTRRPSIVDVIVSLTPTPTPRSEPRLDMELTVSTVHVNVSRSSNIRSAIYVQQASTLLQPCFPGRVSRKLWSALCHAAMMLMWRSIYTLRRSKVTT